MAPEVTDHDGQYTSTVDCWSVGCIVYRLIAGRDLFKNLRAVYTFKQMEASSVSALVDCGGDCPDFVGKLITADPDRRLCAAAALDHPWMLRFSGADKNHKYTISTNLRTRFDKVLLMVDNLKGRLQYSGPNIGIEAMSQGSLEPDITLSAALPKLSDLHVTAVKKSQRPPKKANVKLQQAGFAGESTAL